MNLSLGKKKSHEASSPPLCSEISPTLITRGTLSTRLGVYLTRSSLWSRRRESHELRCLKAMLLLFYVASPCKWDFTSYASDVSEQFALLDLFRLHIICSCWLQVS